MIRTASELCPHCDCENEFQWDTEVDGFKAYCPHCGNIMMLCDLCLHAPITDEYIGGCDYCEKTDSCKHIPPRIPNKEE